MEKKYWKGVEELQNDPEFVRLKNNEFFEHLPVDELISNKAASTDNSTRRDFLKFMGFSVAAASLAACTAPVKKAIPYVIKPEEITLGVPNYYASTSDSSLATICIFSGFRCFNSAVNSLLGLKDGI